MSRIFWDTNLYIYLFEDFGQFTDQVVVLKEKMAKRGDLLFTSALTIGELLVKPTELRDLDLCRKYVRGISASSRLISFDVAVAQLYAGIRGDHTIRSPDAIQLACAAAARVDLFITNDGRLLGKRINGIQFIVPLDRIPI
jgi:predicted nucleic acid-binding protein